MKVLVIENAPTICQRLLSLLAESDKYQGMGCVTCSSVALELIEECRPDALLLDLRLADGSGFKVLETLRATGCPLPTILLADAISAQYQTYAESLGAALLSKSEQFDDILPTLDRLFAMSAAEMPS